MREAITGLPITSQRKPSCRRQIWAKTLVVESLGAHSPSTVNRVLVRPTQCARLSRLDLAVSFPALFCHKGSPVFQPFSTNPIQTTLWKTRQDILSVTKKRNLKLPIINIFLLLLLFQNLNQTWCQGVIRIYYLIIQHTLCFIHWGRFHFYSQHS